MGKKKYEGIEGQSFHKLTALERVAEVSRHVTYTWLCECGKTIKLPASSVVSGNTKSCGCIRQSREVKRSKHNHGLSATNVYFVWKTMRQRCLNPNSRDYKWYGAKGVTICFAWDNPVAFCEWAIASGYQEGATIERIDSDGDYSPENCTWLTIQEQQQNKSNVIRLEYEGKVKTLSEWSKICGVPSRRLYERIYVRKWDVARALYTPVSNAGWFY